MKKYGIIICLLILTPLSLHGSTLLEWYLQQHPTDLLDEEAESVYSTIKALHATRASILSPYCQTPVPATYDPEKAYSLEAILLVDKEAQKCNILAEDRYKKEYVLFYTLTVQTKEKIRGPNGDVIEYTVNKDYLYKTYLSVSALLECLRQHPHLCAFPLLAGKRQPPSVALGILGLLCSAVAIRAGIIWYRERYVLMIPEYRWGSLGSKGAIAGAFCIGTILATLGILSLCPLIKTRVVGAHDLTPIIEKTMTHYDIEPCSRAPLFIRIAEEST